MQASRWYGATLTNTLSEVSPRSVQDQSKVNPRYAQDNPNVSSRSVQGQSKVSDKVSTMSSQGQFKVSQRSVQSQRMVSVRSDQFQCKVSRKVNPRSRWQTMTRDHVVSQVCSVRSDFWMSPCLSYVDFYSYFYTWISAFWYSWILWSCQSLFS